MNEYSSGGNLAVTILHCSWNASLVDWEARAAAAGRRAVLKYGDALQRLADG